MRAPGYVPAARRSAGPPRPVPQRVGCGQQTTRPGDLDPIRALRCAVGGYSGPPTPGTGDHLQRCAPRRGALNPASPVRLARSVGDHHDVERVEQHGELVVRPDSAMPTWTHCRSWPTSASRLVADLFLSTDVIVASGSERRIPAHQVEAVGRRFATHPDFVLVGATGLRHVPVWPVPNTPFGVRCFGTIQQFGWMDPNPTDMEFLQYTPFGVRCLGTGSHWVPVRDAETGFYTPFGVRCLRTVRSAIHPHRSE